MFKKMLKISVQLVTAVSVLSLIYGFAIYGAFTYAHAFTANLVVGVLILVSGLFILITPTALLIKKSRLIDHTTYGEKFMEERENKRLRAYELIYIGIFIISISGIMQLVVWLISH
ncbi:MAG: hypothetical protein FWE24_01095 [Defluviitaleaceae bacterium]|nr:hypothetical protein [Defluviitaleaceae bacterium]